MGQEIGGREFSEEDFARFRSRLAQETRSLRETFAAGQCSNAGPFIGLELEVWLIDHNFFPAPHNQSFLERLADPSVVAELSQFNIEINAPVERIEGRCFQRMHEHLSETMRRCATNAHEDVDTVIAIGTLPTLRQQDLSLEAMTPSHRYYALNREAMRLRGGMPLNIDIDGALPGADHFLACFQGCHARGGGNFLPAPPASAAGSCFAHLQCVGHPERSARRHCRQFALPVRAAALERNADRDLRTVAAADSWPPACDLGNRLCRRRTLPSCSRKI